MDWAAWAATAMAVEAASPRSDWWERKLRIESCVDNARHARKIKSELSTRWEIPIVERGFLEAGELLAHEASNGTRQVKWHCRNCTYVSEAIRYGDLRAHGFDPYEIIVATSRRRDDTVCAVLDCESNDVELHHWAPGSVFTEFGCDLGPDHWPTSYLCRSHHTMWHSMMDNYQWKIRDGLGG